MRIAAPKHSTTTTNHIDENLLPTPSCPKHHAFPFLNDNRFILSRDDIALLRLHVIFALLHDDAVPYSGP